MALWFSNLPVTFLNAFGGYLFILFYSTKLHISIFWTLGFVGQWSLEGEFFLLDRPNLLPSLSCCDSKERIFLVTVVWSEAMLCFLLHTVLSGYQPSWRLCDCCPKGECAFLPPWYYLLFSELCSCSYPTSQPQQGSSVPICCQCFVEHFLLRKRSLVNRIEKEK